MARRAVLVGLGVALLAAVVTIVIWRARVQPLAEIGAGYVAKQTCSCLFVAGRSLEACRADHPSDMQAVRAEAIPEGVRAWVPTLAERTALHVPGAGCTLR